MIRGGRVREAGRRGLVRAVGSLPPPVARLAARSTAFMMRDVGRTRGSATAMARALSVVTSASAGAGTGDAPLLVAEIARRSSRSVDEVTIWAQRGLLGPPAEAGPPERWVGGVERARLVGFLLRRGLDLEALVTAAGEGRLPLLVVESAIAGRGTLTIAQVAEASGMSPDLAERVVRSLGVAPGDGEERLFGRREVRALRILEAMRPVFSEAQLLDTIAVIGRAMSQIAAAEVESFRHGVGRRFAEAGVGELEMALRTAALVDLLAVPTSVLLDVIHRLHLESAVSLESVVRVEEASGGLSGQERATVGFADLVGYTAVSERLSPLALGELSSRLLRIAEEVFAGRGVRVVKTIGDAVMFSARDTAVGCLAALELLELASSRGGLPPLHVGVATGPVLRRHADYFGRTVNIAARIGELAPGGCVLVHGTAGAEAALEAVGLSLEEMGEMPLRGLARPVTVAAVRRAPAAMRGDDIPTTPHEAPGAGEDAAIAPR